MPDNDTPWEPPLAGAEVEHLVGALDRLRTTFRWKADDLDATGLQTRIGASALTLGGLLKHLALTEDYIFTRKLSGEPVGEPWESLWDGTDDWEFTSAVDDVPEQLYAFWEDALERSRARLDAALAHGGLDQLVHVSNDDGEHASPRRLVCDLIEEYGRHTGHADLLREAVDGRVGEDPPPRRATAIGSVMARHEIVRMRLLLIADTDVPKRARDLPARVWAEVADADVVMGRQLRQPTASPPQCADDGDGVILCVDSVEADALVEARP